MTYSLKTKAAKLRKRAEELLAAAAEKERLAFEMEKGRPARQKDGWWTIGQRERDEAVVALRQMGMKQSDVGAEYGLSADRVAQIVAAYDAAFGTTITLDTRKPGTGHAPKPIQESFVIEAIRLRDNGYAWKQIGMILGSTRTTTRRLVRKYLAKENLATPEILETIFYRADKGVSRNNRLTVR